MIVEYAGGMKLVARHRGLEATSDQPESSGGENTAMTPTELFLASIAMCVGIYVLYFATRHEIAVEGMKIEIDHQMSDDPRRVGAIQVRVKMPEPVDPQYQAALQRTAEHCVVHNSLRNPPDVVIAVE